MAEPLLGEIKMFAFPWAPAKYAKCDGQNLSINENTALYSLLGTTFGGNGTTTVGLPDLRGRLPIGEGTYLTSYGNFSNVLGQKGGLEQVTLNLNELPTHTHIFYGNNEEGAISVPLGNDILSQSNASEIYGPANNLNPLNTGTCSYTGGGQPHYNLMPFSTINFCIALDGTYPSRN